MQEQNHSFSPNWGTIIPLIGGMTLGNQMAAGKEPDFLISYPDFNGNDSHAWNWFGTQNKIKIDSTQNKLPDDFLSKLPERIDFISTVPPCAGLSTLSAANGDPNSPINEWMIKSASLAMDLKPKVIMGENAPTLFSDVGVDFLERLKKLAFSRGYSLSLVKTDSRLHGLPQRRMRTFYFIWDSERAPILNWYNRERPTLAEYLNQIPPDTGYTEVFPNNKNLEDVSLWKWREYAIKTFPNFIEVPSTIISTIKSNLLNECMNFLEELGDIRAKERVARVKKSLDMGKNFRTSDVIRFGRNSIDYMNAVQGTILTNTVHPTERRWLNVREYMHMMGLPHDFRMQNQKWNHICQNVPTNTARDWTYEVIKFCKGELELSQWKFLKQDNIKQKIVEKSEPFAKKLF